MTYCLCAPSLNRHHLAYRLDWSMPQLHTRGHATCLFDTRWSEWNPVTQFLGARRLILTRSLLTREIGDRQDQFAFVTIQFAYFR